MSIANKATERTLRLYTRNVMYPETVTNLRKSSFQKDCLIQFSSLLPLCVVRNQKANCRCRTRGKRNNKHNKTTTIRLFINYMIAEKAKTQEQFFTE